MFLCKARTLIIFTDVRSKISFIDEADVTFLLYVSSAESRKGDIIDEILQFTRVLIWS